jgi:hypothetical protein
MPRSFTDKPDDAEIIARCPTSSFTTPQANDPVPIRPLKRLRKEDEEDAEDEVKEEEEDSSQSPLPIRAVLTPRRLDMDQVRAFIFN